MHIWNIKDVFQTGKTILINQRNALCTFDEDSFSGLKYVFDISDVHKARRIGRFPNLWEMCEEHMEAVISRLEKTYGDTDREAGFVGRIREIAGRIAEDCYKELASDSSQPIS